MPETTRRLVEVTGMVGEVLQTARMTWRHETQLQDELSDLLTVAGIEHTREVILTSHRDRIDRIDFLLAGGVGLEVKVQGSVPAVVRQLQRYAHADQVQHLILATTKPEHCQIPLTITSVPLEVHLIQAGAW